MVDAHCGGSAAASFYCAAKTRSNKETANTLLSVVTAYANARPNQPPLTKTIGPDWHRGAAGHEFLASSFESLHRGQGKTTTETLGVAICRWALSRQRDCHLPADCPRTGERRDL